jgi:hypothetical protein
MLTTKKKLRIKQELEPVLGHLKDYPLMTLSLTLAALLLLMAWMEHTDTVLENRRLVSAGLVGLAAHCRPEAPRNRPNYRHIARLIQISASKLINNFLRPTQQLAADVAVKLVPRTSFRSSITQLGGRVSGAVSL